MRFVGSKGCVVEGGGAGGSMCMHTTGVMTLKCGLRGCGDCAWSRLTTGVHATSEVWQSVACGGVLRCGDHRLFAGCAFGRGRC